jgi:hypothetical protein
MNSLRFWVAAGSVLLASQAVAAGQDVSGIGCSSGDLTLVTGATFNARCTGDLRIDPASIIEAGESITLRATGTLWMLGTLVAPRIELVAEASAHVSGGLFSGSPAFFPDVNAVSYAGSLTVSSRNFHDLVPRAYIDPLFGAVTGTLVAALPIAEITPVVMHEFIVIPDETTSPIPEPEQFALFAAGLGLIVWKRRSRHA